DWEPLVKEIETIDRVEDGTLIVFVQWKDGKTTEHPAKVVYKKCPQAMLKFYEERLRFR
ncbi:Swi6 protein, partial [Coemansia reversa NRRL 1564]